MRRGTSKYDRGRGHCRDFVALAVALVALIVVHIDLVLVGNGLSLGLGLRLAGGRLGVHQRGERRGTTRAGGT